MGTDADADAGQVVDVPDDPPAYVPSITYVYDNETIENNIVMYYATDELMERKSVDPLRKELGFEISTFITDDESENPKFIVKEGRFHEEVDKLRDIYFVHMTTDSPYIQKLEINPYRITPLSPKALLPNYSIPVRLYANEENTKGDKWWRTLFIGGEYGGDSYPTLLDTNSIFDDYFFTYANSYSMLYAKSIGIQNTATNIYEISSIYNTHNIDTTEYQKWSVSRDDVLLIPSYHIFETIGEDGQTQLSTPLQQYTAITSSNAVFDIDMAEISDTLDRVDESFNSDTGKSYMETTYFPNLISAQISADIQQQAILSQQNFMFDQNYYGDPQYGQGLKVTNFPYYNIIRFNRHVQDSIPITPRLGGSYDGLNREKFFIRNAIESNNFSAKFLETLKDIHEGTWPFFRFGSKNLNVETSKLKLSPGTQYGVETQRKIHNKPYRALDLTKMFQTMYNYQDASINSNYTFIGPDAAAYHTTYQDNKLYRYYDTQNLIGTMDNIYDHIKSKYQFPQDQILWADEYNVIQQALSNTEDILNFVFNPHFCHAETIAYRIEKTGGETFGDYNTSKVIQNYWVFNSKNAPEELKFFDTQVKYAQDYTYKCYAYVAVLGKRYKYGDFRLTKQISLLDQGMDAEDLGVHGALASDGNIDYYCLQFYEPLSGDLSPQLFNSGTGRKTELNFERRGMSQESYLRGTSDSSALSQRNEFATDQQDLSVHPQIADFILHVEPCIKLIEIPLFKKKIKMLDSPANDMIAIPFQYIDNSKRIGFNMRYESFNQMRPYPVSITKEDRRMHLDYLNSRDILPGGDITESAMAQQRYIEVYRTDKKPTSFADFEGKLVDTIDLKIEDSYYTFPDAIHTVKIPTNKKFYYVFRYVTENLVPGHMSQILECELIDDGDYIYSKFNVLFDELAEEVTLTEPTKTLKKLLQIEPNISQISLDTSGVDFSKTSRDQINNLNIGNPGIDLIWNKKFKVRLTSKKTGKQIDLNIKYETKEEDRINIEKGSIASLGEFSGVSRFTHSVTGAERFGFLSGLDSSGTVSMRPGAEPLMASSDGDLWHEAIFTDGE